jgi:uncharacterized protein YqjF (DUF2071 family)
MYHSWRNLTFLHWPVAAEQLQRLLPPGLTVDAYEGVAYVGLVAFTMCDMRLSWFPAVPGLHASHETNVRTYVVDENGVPGVWFFSLDAVNLAFVHIARAWYHLPYRKSTMRMRARDGAFAYHSSSSLAESVLAGCAVEVETCGEPAVAEPGTLEFFLIERYVLFSYHRNRLLVGYVYHTPYPLLSAKCGLVEEALIKAAQIERPLVPPIVHFSPGVDVEVFGLRRSRIRE